MVDKDIRAALAYDESIALGIIEPLYCSLFWHRFLATYEFAFQSNPRFAQASTLVFGAPNEKEMSCRERERASQRIDGLNSCEAG